MDPTTPESLKQAVYELVEPSSSGEPAIRIVDSIATARGISPDAVRRVLLNLLDCGEVALGPNFNVMRSPTFGHGGGSS